MLTAYIQQTQRLLNDVTQVIFNPYDLISYINTARGQLAGESESVKVYASLQLSQGTNVYPFASINLASTPGVAGVFNARQALIKTGGAAAALATISAGTVSAVSITAHGSGYSTIAPNVAFSGGGGIGAAALATISAGTVSAISIQTAGSGYTVAPAVSFNGGMVWVRPRPWEWFTYFRLNNPSPTEAQPNEWSQFGQGVSGSIFVSPVPDQTYTLSLDTTCYPIALATDSDPEAIPYPWTDAIPFFAAYYGYMSIDKEDDAQRMLTRYRMFADRARAMSNATVMPYIYQQSGDPFMANRLNVQPASDAK